MRGDAIRGRSLRRTGRRPTASCLAAGMASALALALAVPAFAQPAAHWSYTGDDGPDHWGELSAAYKTCAAGHEQSPIDIWRTRHAGSAAPLMQYFPAPLRVVNDGHTIQVDYGPGSTLVTDGKTYALSYIRFHSPSEHQIRDQRFAMEAELFHRANDGSLAVVGILLEEGAENPFLARVLSSVPAEVGVEAEVAGGPAEPSNLLPGRSGFFYYNGSLTTPPCSEGVRWFVMDATGTVSRAQVERFLALVSENARPVQPLEGRFVEHRM